MAGNFYTIPDDASIRHHETDSASYADFLERMERQYSQLAEGQSKVDRERRDAFWESSLPERYRGGDLMTMTGDDMSTVRLKIRRALKGNGSLIPSMLLHGEAQTSKTYTAYAILREFYLRGLFERDQLKVFSQEDLDFQVSAGFKGKDFLSDLFNPKYAVYLIENIELGKPSSDKTWEFLISHIYSNSLSAIFTSTHSLPSLMKDLSPVSASRFDGIIDFQVKLTTKSKERRHTEALKKGLDQ